MQNRSDQRSGFDFAIKKKESNKNTVMSVEKTASFIFCLFFRMFFGEEFRFTITLPLTPHLLQSLPSPPPLPQKEMLFKTKCNAIVLILFIRFGKSGSISSHHTKSFQ